MNKFKHYRDKVFHHVQTILTKTLVALVNRWKLCRNHWGIYFIWLCSKTKQNCWTMKLKTIFFSEIFFAIWNQKVVLYHVKTSEYPLKESSKNLLEKWLAQLTSNSRTGWCRGVTFQGPLVFTQLLPNQI